MTEPSLTFQAMNLQVHFESKWVSILHFYSTKREGYWRHFLFHQKCQPETSGQSILSSTWMILYCKCSEKILVQNRRIFFVWLILSIPIWILFRVLNVQQIEFYYKQGNSKPHLRDFFPYYMIYIASFHLYLLDWVNKKDIYGYELTVYAARKWMWQLAFTSVPDYIFFQMQIQ